MDETEVLLNDGRYNLRPWVRQKDQHPLAIERAEGIFLWDYRGKRYFDMSSQLVNVNLGYGSREINRAIAEQLERFAYIAPAHGAASRSALAKTLVEKSGGMAKVFFTCGGAESNDNAAQIARAFTGRAKIFSAYRSYHGSTQGAGNLSGDPRRFAVERPAIPGYIKFMAPYIYRETLPFKTEEEISAHYLWVLREQILAEGPQNIAAITLEAVAGTSGVIIPPKGYLPGIRKLCDEFGILLHFDEVMTGFYRTGTLFAFQNFGVTADIITFAKGVTSGYVPLGGVLVSHKIAAFYDDNPLLCGLTYNGHPLSCAAGNAALRVYDELHIEEHVRRLGAALRNALLDLEQRHPSIGNVRSIGLFSALELVKNRATKEPLVSAGNLLDALSGIIALLRERGFLTIGRNNNIMIAPPLIITESELNEALNILDEVLSIVDGSL
ncbi:MAG: aminotransferase class III-fold pyridoxal phosphate-dependent enzyme [Spirochaetaceae bacterium]|nr:aminotransferase class III-fold pyridoxal phosphate-dependent enzyme [Spirochaetaceae bacterium]